MNSIVIEHVPVDELPESWRARLQAAGNTRVTVHIEEEAADAAHAAYGMWRDRDETADPAGLVRHLRTARFPRD